MQTNAPGEFDNSEFQKQLAKILLKELNRESDTPHTPEEIYENFFEPIPVPCSVELVTYTIKRILEHDDEVLSARGEYPCPVEIVPAQVGEYIQVHLDTAGDPFPEVDPEPYL